MFAAKIVLLIPPSQRAPNVACPQPSRPLVVALQIYVQLKVWGVVGWWEGSVCVWRVCVCVCGAVCVVGVCGAW